MPRIFILLVTLLILTVVCQASAEVEIVSLFSDENSMDVTLRSTTAVEGGQLVFKLTHRGTLVETQTMELHLAANTTTTRVIMWNTRPRYETYVSYISVRVNDAVAAERSYPFSYGFVVLPRFRVVDLSADNMGVNLLLRPSSAINPAVADFTIQLLHDGNIIHSETKKNVPVIQPTLINVNWPILLDDHTDYIVRVKAFSHTPEIISSYTATFTSGQEVEINDNDVDVDDFGASVTLLGRSQVPFDGMVEVELVKDSTSAEVFTGKPDILTLNQEDTVGIIWNDLAPGIYHVLITAKTLDGEVLDRYETVLRIPERVNPVGQPTQTPTPGFGVLLTVVILLTAIALRK